jgi:hypothetical protein
MATKHMFAKSPLAQDAFAQLGGKTACGQGEYFYNELPRAGPVLPLPAGTPRERLSNRICGLVVRGFTPRAGCALGKWTRFGTQTG